MNHAQVVICLIKEIRTGLSVELIYITVRNALEIVASMNKSRMVLILNGFLAHLADSLIGWQTLTDGWITSLITVMFTRYVTPVSSWSS